MSTNPTRKCRRWHESFTGLTPCVSIKQTIRSGIIKLDRWSKSLHVQISYTSGSGDVDQYVDEREVELWRIRAEERIYFLNIDLFENEYWERAGVTQDIVLARCIVVSLGTEVFNYSDLFYHTTYMPELCIDNSFYQFEYIN
jgi:hypothetical protein